MDILFNLLLFTHLVALAVAATTPILMPLLARTLMAGGDSRSLLGPLAKRLGTNSQIAFGVLVLTGIVMLFLRYGGAEGASPWFHAKMGLIVVMIIVMVVARLGKITPQVQVWTMRALLLGIVFCAVMAFS